LDKRNIQIFYSKVGKEEIMLFNEKEDDISYGHVGFGTFRTTAAFDNIFLRPIVAVKRIIFIKD
jgi:hypothetical protein